MLPFPSPPLSHPHKENVHLQKNVGSESNYSSTVLNSNRRKSNMA